MKDDYIDLIITSPPYFNAKSYNQYLNINDYLNQIKEIFSLCFKKLKKSRMIAINISPILIPRKSRKEQSFRIPLPFYFVPLLEDIGFEFLEDIIWEKPSGSVPNRNGGFFKSRKPVAYKPNIIHEYILIFKKPAPFLIDKVLKNNSLVLDDYEKTSIWKINPDNKNWHPAPFPEKLAENIIKYYSYINDIVYDPFAGSGTVGKVCKKLNRNWILSENNKNFYNKIKI